MLGLAACQTDPEGIVVGGEVDAVINVNLPVDETRASAGRDSAEGAILNGVLGTEDDNTTLRYILQVYHNGEPSKSRLVEYSDGKQVSFTVRLAPGRDYQFVVWADVVADGENDTDNHYNTSDLANITLKGEWNAMDESRDAYTATVPVNDYDGTAIDITLKRPFAKLRVVTTDIEALTNIGIAPTSAVVEYQTAHREAFNAVSGQAAGATRTGVTHAYTIGTYANESNTGAEYTLFTDYFFADNDIVKFNMDVMDEAGESIKENSFNTDINVRRNHLTTIMGNILTDGANVTVTVEDAFDGVVEYNVNDIQSAFNLQQAINDANDGVNTVITLGADINNGTFPIIVPAGKVITLNLNEKTISGEVERSSSIILNEGTLTIENGTVASTATNGGSAIMNKGTLTLNDMTANGAPSDIATGTAAYAVNSAGAGSTLVTNNANISGRGAIGATKGTKVEINGGTYHTPAVAGGHAIYAVNEGTEVIINDGTFSEGYAADGNNYGMYQIYSGEKAKVTVKGGDFQPWDCANGYDLCTASEGVIEIYGGFFAEDPADQGGKNYAAPGYLTIKINDTRYTVMKGSIENGVETFIIEDSFDFTAFAAIVDEGATFESDVVKLTEDITLPEENWNPIGDNRTDAAFSGTFDGQGHTISGAQISGDFCFNGSVYGSKEGWGLFSVLDGATVKNVKLDDEVFASYTVISGAVAGYAQDTTFENIDITNTKIAGYNWYTGGVVGWAAGNCTFKNVNLDSSVVVGTLWDSHGQNAGGIAGGVSGDGTYVIEDCNIACVMDVINDVTSNYKWYIYRVSGMIIGNTNTTETKYNEVVTATATNVTCKNVTVTYGDWMNYHYCQGYWNRGWGRVESSDYVGGIDHTQCNHPDGEQHYVCIPFDQLFGGSSNGSGHYPVRGLPRFEGVTVNYPASYVRSVSGQAELELAISDGVSEVVVAAGTYTFPASSIKAGTVIKCEEGTVFEGNSKLNIGGSTVIGATFSNPSGTAVDQTINGTFKDCTFTGSNGLRWCYAGETVVFENCVFEGDVYGVHFDGGANDVVFKNCVLSGFNAFGGAITELTLEGCTLKAGRSGYNGINLWGNTTMKDCKFEFDGTKTEWVDFMGDNKTYVIENCELNGVVCTVENRDELGILVDYGTGNTIKINGVEL